MCIEFLCFHGNVPLVTYAHFINLIICSQHSEFKFIKTITITFLIISSRSQTGMGFLACSWDGTVVYMSFSEAELGHPLSKDEKIALHTKIYGSSLEASSNATSCKGNQIIESADMLNIQVWYSQKFIYVFSLEFIFFVIVWREELSLC